MAGKVIAVDLDEAAQALKLLSEYILGGESLVCRIGVVGTDVGVTSDFYQRLAQIESKFVSRTDSIRELLEAQYEAIAFAVKSLAEMDASLSEGAKELLAQIDAMRVTGAPAEPTSSAVNTFKK